MLFIQEMTNPYVVAKTGGGNSCHGGGIIRTRHRPNVESATTGGMIFDGIYEPHAIENAESVQDGAAGAFSPPSPMDI